MTPKALRFLGVEEKNDVAPEDAQIPVRGIELPCISHIFEAKTPKKYIQKTKKNEFMCKIQFTVSLFPFQ